MFNNELEEQLFKSLICFYDKEANNLLRFEWEDNTVIEAYIDTFYETDNDIEMDENGYEEYHVCLICIKRVINISQSSLCNMGKKELEPNKLFEISYHNAPDKVYSIDNRVIWRK